MKLVGQDISHQVYRSYANCTQGDDGLMYADSDYYAHKLGGRKDRGLPCPQQDTPEKTAKALAMWVASGQEPPPAWRKKIEEAKYAQTGTMLAQFRDWEKAPWYKRIFMKRPIL